MPQGIAEIVAQLHRCVPLGKARIVGELLCHAPNRLHGLRASGMWYATRPSIWTSSRPSASRSTENKHDDQPSPPCR